MAHSIERVHITVDGVRHALAPLEAAEDLRRQTLTAVHADGGFLTVTVDDGSKLSILVTTSTSITISVSTVELRPDGADSEQDGWVPPVTSYEDDVPFDLI